MENIVLIRVKATIQNKVRELPLRSNFRRKNVMIYD